ncbi:putative sodium-coupled neutral amino acid transporter 7 isoform X1 [Rhipicephalus sanguineus]|uniref:putative sodium-coupled neutral amino acid transporter 7 isoform X1 n=1 Tax=Rhipicephalus sanguineus TaxID=34632 RepID=UPI001894419F|nr:putative sodium-coupled neutral amino acid transporter 7 isoform X1 [Rhipicephalus sanguineus]
MPSRRKGTVSCSEAFASTAANGISAGAYYRRGPGGNFIQDSFHSSTDMPTYIAWQTLSTDLSERMRQGSVRLSRTNTLEYAPIAEDDEKTPLLNIQDAASFSKSSVSTPTVEQGVAWTVAAFLLVNSALGAGVLNYPAAYDRAGGILAATLLQILMICLNVVTMLILGYCADLNGDNTFHDVLLTTCGRRAQQIAAASILLSCYGVCITFLIVIGDQYDRLFTSLLGPLFCHEWYLNRQFTTCATAVLFILPLCYFQRLDFLKYASTLGIFVMLYPVFLTIFIFSTEELEIVTMKTKPDSLIDLVVILPVICFAYQAHEVVVPIYANMRDRRLANLAKATILTTAFLFIIYTLMGTFGYMAYGSVVKPDIMQMFDASNPWVLFGIVALIVKMVTTYPLLTFCGRGAFDGLYAEFTKLPAKEFIKGESRRRIFITTGWFLTTVGFATFTSNVGVVIDLLGCLAAANIFIFPGLCLLGVFHQQEKFGLRRPMVAFAIGAVMVVIGSFIFGVVLLNTIMHDITEGDSHHLLCT